MTGREAAGRASEQYPAWRAASGCGNRFAHEEREIRPEETHEKAMAKSSKSERPRA